MKRIVLFLATNLAVMLVLSVTLNVLGVNRFLAADGLNVGMLVVFSAVVGFGGAFISLLMSKRDGQVVDRRAVIDAPQSADEQWLVSTVQPPRGQGRRSACPRSPSTRASRTRSPPAPSATRRWSRSPRGSCSR